MVRMERYQAKKTTRSFANTAFLSYNMSHVTDYYLLRLCYGEI